MASPRSIRQCLLIVLLGSACHKTELVNVTVLDGDSGADSSPNADSPDMGEGDLLPGDPGQDDDPGDTNEPSSFGRRLTIDHTKVAADYTGFPLLVATANDPQLRTEQYGGHVTDPQGHDIYFEDANGALLSFELERYEGETGTVIAWVGIPFLPSDEDLLLWLRYGQTCPCVSKADPAGVWSETDQAVYHLDHDFRDSTAHAHHGTPHGAPPFVDGPLGNGASFNGTSQYVDTGFGAGTAGLIRSWTVSCWVKANTDPGSTRDTGPLMHERNFNLAWHHTSLAFQHTTFFATYNTPHEDWWGASFGDLVHDTWYFLAGTYDGATLTAYTNGVMTNQITDINQDPVAEPTTAKIGRHGVTADWYFDGQVDEVRISATLHSPGWIQTIYNNQAAPSTFVRIGAEEPFP